MAEDRGLRRQISELKMVIAEQAFDHSVAKERHELRVQELLEANNRYLDRARKAEAALLVAERTIQETLFDG